LGWSAATSGSDSWGSSQAGVVALVGGYEVGVFRFGVRAYDAMLLRSAPDSDRNSPHMMFRYGAEVRARLSRRSPWMVGIGALNVPQTDVPFTSDFSATVRPSSGYVVIGGHSPTTLGFRQGLDVRLMQDRVEALVSFYGAYR
jgi:hypothetical protein